MDNSTSASVIVPTVVGMSSPPPSGPAAPAGTGHPALDILLVDLPRLASRLDLVADDLARRGQESRAGFAPVVWDGDARRALDSHLARLDAELAGIVGEIRRCAASLRASGEAGS